MPRVDVETGWRHSLGVRGVPQLSHVEIAFLAVELGRPQPAEVHVARGTVWRWLAEDAIRPWNYRSWIFARDPNFAEKAGRFCPMKVRGVWVI